MGSKGFRPQQAGDKSLSPACDQHQAAGDVHEQTYAS
jgi:hypothetical protein